MYKTFLVPLLVVSAVFLAVRPNYNFASAVADNPQFTSDGKLVRPADYRRWIYLSSGFGMSYTQKPDDAEMFTNVFVEPAAYDYYLANGRWPGKAMFVLELYVARIDQQTRQLPKRFHGSGRRGKRRSAISRQMGVFQF
jgi:hypothetical protein